MTKQPSANAFIEGTLAGASRNGDDTAQVVNFDVQGLALADDWSNFGDQKRGMRLRAFDFVSAESVTGDEEGSQYRRRGRDIPLVVDRSLVQRLALFCVLTFNPGDSVESVLSASCSVTLRAVLNALNLISGL